MNLGNNVKLDYPSTTIRLGLAPELVNPMQFGTLPNNLAPINTLTFKSLKRIGLIHNFLISLGELTPDVLQILREFKPYTT